MINEMKGIMLRLGLGCRTTIKNHRQRHDDPGESRIFLFQPTHG